MSDTRPEPAGPAGDAPAYVPKPADQAPTGPAPTGPILIRDPVHILRGTVTGVDAHHYTVSLEVEGLEGVASISYNPLAYIPRLGEGSGRRCRLRREQSGAGVGAWHHIQEHVRQPDLRPPPDSGLVERHQAHHRIRNPAAPSRQDGPQGLGHRQHAHRARQRSDDHQDHPATDRRVHRQGRRSLGERPAVARAARHGPPLGRQEQTSPRPRDHRPRREGAQLRGECSHSVSADIRITTSIDPAHASPWVRYLGAAVELIAYQTSGRRLRLMSDHVSKPFLQMTYQGPMP
jgi:hypothetical protein